MADQYEDDEDEFNNDEVQKIASKAIVDVFNFPDVVYERTKVNQWTQQIIDNVIKELARSPKKFKYVVTCCIQQDCGAGLVSASCTMWEGERDGYIAVNFQAPTFTVYVTVFAPHI